MLPIILCLPFVVLFTSTANAYLIPRDSTPVCTNLRAQSNNGDRKIALVIDSSGSMEESDPYNYRLSAAKMVLDWLISKSEVTSTQKQDEVAIINFDDKAYLDYPLGDPGAAASSLAQIGADGGTYIAGGVQMAIKQLSAANTGDTAGRSGILVFTDGEDSSTQDLVDQINRATSLGIRVAFGFLDDSSSLQDTDVLSAIMHSGGRYFTIQNYNASKAFIDGIIVNGLTHNDNPDGDTTTLLAGLDASHFISGSETQTMIYSARAKEQLTFNVQSVDAGTLTVQIVSGGKTLDKGQSDYYSSYYSDGYSVVAPSTDTIDVKVTADNAAKNSIFVVGVTSNLPPENCTVGVGDAPKKNNVPQIVEGTVSSVVGLVVLAGIGYFIYKYCYKKRCGKRHPHHDKDKDHSSDHSLDPKHPTETSVREVPGQDSNPSRIPWFSFPPPLPPTYHHPPKKTMTTDDQDRDRDMDEDSGSEAPSYNDNCDNQSQFSDPPDKLNSDGPPYHNANPPSQPPCQNSNPPYQNGNPPSQPSYPDQPQDPSQPSNPNQPSNPHQPSNPNQPSNPPQPSDHELHPHPHIYQPRTYGSNHHHHISASHPCFTKRCPIASPTHVCSDPSHPCTCADPKCPLNRRRHRCRDQEQHMPPPPQQQHTCAGPDSDPRCPLNDAEYARRKKEEREMLVKKYTAQDRAKGAVKMAVSTVAQGVLISQLG
ncbi:uncharacterized protein Z520_10857 [Fonsecaea multimorphosa CBS 102226]|uniref:VWFA domain-containing protein n=1 Tax=Fonsecaea multimorphosa CBS 102226 TaxID=1442371 RepID=A0A0D2KAJ1_9EURO|nr:uncharacterized protein Z520_10857 [Fonsecaea multimorphosa CBS 102226]KIX93438.1 hypothetical protein Z520_10857 [Fonsecaea multimorphosa CBS 102226]OAL18735.1 hypothetical protein AYO22_10428 [Fonsecaea multimorphosa]